ncbi:MAG: histidine phosphatase family protein [Saprospiraceae bacterium]|nr:histidine phosphatase family protein [Saprospiraceae bacterium]
MWKEVLFVRHGETELNRLGIVQGSGIDPELNETGLNQARLFHERYSQVPFEVVITSTLKRTHLTVEPFIEKGIPWISHKGINEISWGDHEGRPSEPYMVEAYNQLIQAWGEGDLDVRLPNGESASELITRIDHFLEELINRPESRILVCSHGRAIRCLISRIKRLPPAAMELVSHSNTGVYHIRITNGVPEFLLENDTSHLYEQ